jgi:hypothetical protein
MYVGLGTVEPPSIPGRVRIIKTAPKLNPAVAGGRFEYLELCLEMKIRKFPFGSQPDVIVVLITHRIGFHISFVGFPVDLPYILRGGIYHPSLQVLSIKKWFPILAGASVAAHSNQDEDAQN